MAGGAAASPLAAASYQRVLSRVGVAAWQAPGAVVVPAVALQQQHLVAAAAWCTRGGRVSGKAPRSRKEHQAAWEGRCAAGLGIARSTTLYCSFLSEEELAPSNSQEQEAGADFLRLAAAAAAAAAGRLLRLRRLAAPSTHAAVLGHVPTIPQRGPCQSKGESKRADCSQGALQGAGHSRGGET